MDTVLVMGATGATGSATVTALAGRGVRVRVLVRDAARRPGPADEVAVADLDDGPALAAALAGVDAVYLTTPSAPDAAERQIRVADAAVAAGVTRLVVLSQLGADLDSPVRFLRWHARVEDHLRSLPVAVTVLRPNLFLQSVGGFAAHGRFAAPLGDAAVSAIDVRDIGEVAATVLTEDGHDGATYTLTGPRAVTHQEMAAAFADASGAPVTFDGDVAPDVLATYLDGVLPPWQVGGLLEDYAHYARGEAAVVDPAIERILGRPARDVVDYARDHAGLFVSAA